MEEVYKTFKAISISNKEARKNNNYYKLLENGQALLDYIPEIIDVIVESEHEYRKVEATLANTKDDKGKLYANAYCETQAKATEAYKNYRKAELIRDWAYESIQLSKKLAVDNNNNLKTQI